MLHIRTQTNLLEAAHVVASSFVWYRPEDYFWVVAEFEWPPYGLRDLNAILKPGARRVVHKWHDLKKRVHARFTDLPGGRGLFVVRVAPRRPSSGGGIYAAFGMRDGIFVGGRLLKDLGGIEGAAEILGVTE